MGCVTSAIFHARNCVQDGDVLGVGRTLKGGKIMPFTERPVKSVTWDDKKGVPYIRLVMLDGEIRVWRWICNDWQEEERGSGGEENA